MPKPIERVLVLGATGHIGQAVVRHALANGREVTAASRRADAAELQGLGVKMVQTDGEFSGLDDLAAGYDLLVDAAAPYLLGLGLPGTPEWSAQVDYSLRRTESVIKAARRHGLRLAFVSSYATLPRKDGPLEGAAALWRRSVCPYFEAKAAMEQAVIAAAREGLPAVIVNPAAFVGPWEFRQADWNFVPLVLAGKLPVVTDGTMCVIDVRDVADAIDRALARELYGRVIPLAGHNICPWDLVMRTARLAGVPSRPPLVVNALASSAAAYWAHLAYQGFGLRPPPFLGFITLSSEIMPLEHSPEQLALGVTIRPLEQSLRDAVAFHQARLADWTFPASAQGST
jgi:nucleoside-diphosphate-sugar epimerase